MLDTLIPYLEQHPEFPHFHLDGQTVCLEDYLEVRPEQEERLQRLIEAGRIAVGPWYVLPDLQCIGQESILRNLSRGLALAQRFGGGTPVGYLPDIFFSSGAAAADLRRVRLPRGCDLARKLR